MTRPACAALLCSLALQLVAHGTQPRLADLPLQFVQNQGQVEARTAFTASAPGSSLALQRDGIRFAVPYARHQADAVGLRFAGASPDAALEGESRLDVHTHFFAGSDRSKWIQDAPTYESARYRGLYPGTDLRCYGHDGRLEYDWILAPGASPSRIRMAMDGVRSLKVGAQGELLARTAHGLVRQGAPVAYQMVDGERRPVQARFRIGKDGQVGFALGAYDRSRELVIDPTLDWANTYATGSAPNYTGGTFEIYGNGGMAVDPTSGDLFITWTDYSEPAGGGSYATHLHVKRVHSDGTTTGGSAYDSTFGGAAFHDDQVRDIKVDSSGNAYVTGSTNDTSFPATVGSLSGYTAFLTKVNSTGSVTFSSLFAGGTNPNPQAVAIDASGNAFVCGSTTSTSFPGTSGAFQPSHANDQTKNASEGGAGYGSDAWIAKLAAADGSLVRATYLGGDDQDSATSIAVDSSGNVYVAGSTSSPSLATAGAYQQTHGSDAYDPGDGSSVYNNDAFVAKLSNDLSSRSWFTYLGAESSDQGVGLAVDSAGHPCLLVNAYSTGFPHSVGAYQTSHANDGGNEDAYLAKFSSDGSSLLVGTYLGGSGDEVMDHLALDNHDNFLVSGTSTVYIGGGNTFPLVNSLYAYDANNGSPIFARVTADGRYVAMGTALSSGTTYGSGSPLPDGTQNVLGLAWNPVTHQAYVAGTSGTFNSVALKAAGLGINTAPCLGNAALGNALTSTPFNITYADLVTASLAEDPDGDTFSFIVQAVNHGTLTKNGSAVTPGVTTLAAGDTWVWTPGSSDLGGSVTAFTYSGSDGSHNSAAYQATASVADGTPPSGTFDVLQGGSSVNNQTVSGTVVLSATASDSSGIRRVTFYVDATYYTSVASAPYTANLDTSKLANGAHTLLAYMVDNAGNISYTNPEHTYITSNNVDTLPPTGSTTITGSSGTITFSTNASDPSGVGRVTYYVDGHFYKSVYAAPFQATLDSTKLSNGTHYVLTYAVDSLGNLGYLDHGKAFTVNN